MVNQTATRTVMSDNKIRRKFYQNAKPEVINVAEMSADGPSTVVPVDEQLDTIRAIAGYNKVLPAKRKAKGESLPEIPTSNIVGRKRIIKEYKKSGTKTIEFTSFHKVGMVDGGEKTEINNDRYSMTAKQRALHRAASQQKIERIRTYYGNLLGSFTPTGKTSSESKLAPPEKVPIAQQTPVKSFVAGLHNPSAGPPCLLDNPFTPTQYQNQISLSVYNRPKSMAMRRPGPGRISDELISRLPGYKAPTGPAHVGPDGEPLVPVDAQSVREPVLPEFVSGDKWQ